MPYNKAFLIMGIPIFLVGCTVSTSGTTSTTSTSTMHTQPTTAQAVKRDIVGYDIFPAGISIPQEANAVVLPPYQAPVEKINVKVGDWVRRGAPILQLSIPTVQASLDSASVALKQAQAAYDGARAQLSGPVKAAEAQLAQARAAEQSARGDAAQTGDNTQLQQATTTRQSAEAAVAQAKAEQRANLANYSSQLAAAETAYRQAKAGTRESLVKAPITGMVVALNVAAGQQIGQDANQPIAQIVDLDRMRVTATLTPDQATRLRKGMEVVLRFQETGDEQFTGRIETLTTVPMKSSNGTAAGTQWQCSVRVNDPKRLIKPNMLVTMCGVKTGEVYGVISVPVAAIAKNAGGQTYVDVQQGNTWTPKAVQIGLSDGQYVQITSGLSENETVQVPPQKPL